MTASLHETFRKCLEFILNILYMFDVRFMSRGKFFLAGYTWVQTFCLKILFEHFVEILATSEFLKQFLEYIFLGCWLTMLFFTLPN